MRNEEIWAALARIEALVKDQVPSDDLRQAIEDIFNAYGLTAQLAEVYGEQRDAVTDLIGRLQTHDTALRAHDAQAVAWRSELGDLLVQLRELMRKLVRNQEDLARAVGGGDGARTKDG